MDNQTYQSELKQIAELVTAILTQTLTAEREIPRPDLGQPFPFGRDHWAAFGSQSFAPAQFALWGENPLTTKHPRNFMHPNKC